MSIITKKGFSPYISNNGNWFVYDQSAGNFVDTGILAIQSDDSGESVSHRDNYTELLNLPQINGITLTGNKNTNNITEWYNNTTQAGLVPAPTDSKKYAWWGTDNSGIPSWQNDYLQIKGICSNIFPNTSSRTWMFLAPYYSVLDLNVQLNDRTNYFKAVIKKICEIFPNESGTFIGRAIPDSQGWYAVYIYNTNNLSEDGLPRYSSGHFFSYGASNILNRFGTQDYEWYYTSFDRPVSTITLSETIGEDSAPSSSGTWLRKGYKTFNSGTWIIKFTGQFASNTTGYRRIKISDTNSTSNPGGLTTEDLTQIATPGVSTIMTVTAIRKFTTDTTLYFYMMQNSGSNLNTWGRLQYVKLTNV